MAHYQSRKTRIVCVSDTHNTTPPLPKGDVLIHAGDLTNQGSFSELEKAVEWISKAPYEAKIVIAGNHDITLDQPFYEEHGLSFHNQHPQDPAQCIQLLSTAPGITYLNHSAAHIKLTSAAGPQTHFRVFGSPYSPDTKGQWAFRYAAGSARAAQLWAAMPAATDVAVAHTPPATHRDATVSGAPAGCEALRRALWRVRPKLLVCGHLHEGRGVEVVRWRLDAAGPPFAEEATRGWEDPGAGQGNRRVSAVDLTARGSLRLDSYDDGEDEGKERLQESSGHGHGGGDAEAERGLPSVTEYAALNDADALPCGDVVKAKSTPKSVNPGKKLEMAGLADVLGTNQSWWRNDVEGRLARRETCIVNAAIMANSWGGPKRFNKPIVVSIDLPVWEDWMEDVAETQ